MMFTFIVEGIYVIKNLIINWTYLGNVVVTLPEEELVLPVRSKVNPAREAIARGCGGACVWYKIVAWIWN